MNENERLKALRAKEEEDKELARQTQADTIVDELSEQYPYVDDAVIIAAFNRGWAVGYNEGFNDAPANW